MEYSLCDASLHHLPLSSEVENLYTTYVVNCAFNAFLSYTAITFNIITIHAIRKTSSLSKPLKTLLLCLAVSDLGIGLLGQPFYVALLIMALTRSGSSCVTNTTFLSILGVFCSASFLSIMALTGDRFVAVQFHLRYQQMVTHRRIVIIVIVIWLFSAVTPLFYLWINPDVINFVYAINGMIFLASISLVYLKIYLIVRRHQNQIRAQVQQVAQNSGMANIASLRKSAVSMFYVYLLFLICYCPHFCAITAIAIYGPGKRSVINEFLIFTLTVVFLNSTMNPVVYCWKMRHIRHSIINIIRGIFPSLS